MKWLLLFIVALGVLSSRADAAPPPIRAGQPHGDVFECCGVGSLQPYNPLSVSILGGTRTIAYRLLTMPGCITGSVPNDLLLMADDLRNATARAKGGALNLVRNDAAYSFTIRANCGQGQISICGSVNIFCLGRGFPQNPDVEISDIINTYPLLTRISILCHEICGHALLTWMEQYCLANDTALICQGLAQFASAPGWVDIMNTGPNSRHLLGDTEIERIQRTGLPFEDLPPACVPTAGAPCWLDSRWRFVDGWSFAPNDGCGEWFNPRNVLEWAACASDWPGRWKDDIKRWVNLQTFEMLDPNTGIWSKRP